MFTDRRSTHCSRHANPQRSSGTATPRWGFTVVEMITTFGVLGAAIAISTPMLVSVARQRLGIQQRQFAIQHAGNLLERHSARPWNDLTPGPQSLADASADLQALLPDLKQSLEIKELPEKPISRRLTVSVSWRGPSGVFTKPVQLTTWIFQPEEK